MRRPAATLLLLLLAACGGSDAPDGSPTDAPPRTPGPGPFTLEVESPAKPGRRPQVTVGGDADGVAVTLIRPEDPRPLAPLLATLGAAVPAGVAGEEVASADAASIGSLPPLPAGLYVVEAHREDDAKRALLAVADLELLVLRSRSEILVFATDPESGSPSRGASVVTAREDRSAEGTTDATGVFRTGFPAGPAAGVLVRADGRFGVATADAVKPRPESPEVLLVVDREAARPGQTVRFGLLARRPGSFRPARYRAETAGGLLLAEGELATGNQAIGIPFASDPPPPEETPLDERVYGFELPDETPAGPVTLAVEGPDGRAETTFRVTSEPRPPVRLTVAVPPRAVAGETVPVLVSGRFPAGGRAVDAPVAYACWPEGRPAVPALEGRGRLDRGGALSTSFTPGEPGRWILELTAPDPVAGPVSVRREIEVRPAAFTLSLQTERRWIRTGEPLRVRLGASFPDGAARAVSGSLRLLGGPEGMTDRSRNFFVAPGDRPVLEFEAPEPGVIDLEARAEDEAGRVVAARAAVRVVGGEGEAFPDGIVVVPDRESYLPGERARVLVLLPLELRGSPVLTLVSGDRLGPHAVETVSGPVRVFETTVPPGIGARARFLVAAAGPGGLRTGGATARVGGDPDRVRPRIDFYREKDSPGIDLKLVDAQGRGRAGRGLVVVRAGGTPVLFRSGVEIPAEGTLLPLPDLPPGEPGHVTVEAFTGDGRPAAATTEVPPSADALELLLPSFLVEGDIAILRAAAGRGGTRPAAGRLELSSDGLLLMSPAQMPVDLPAGGALAEFEGTFSAGRPGQARVKARLTLGDEVREAEGRLVVLPRARREQVTATGRVEKGVGSAWVEVPRGFRPEDTEVKFHLSSSPAAATDLARATSPRPAPGDAEDVLGRAFLARPDTRAPFVALAARQRGDGGWGRGADGGSDPAVTARILEALEEMRQAGRNVAGPDLGRATTRLRDALDAGLAESDPDAAAFAAAALAAPGEREPPYEPLLHTRLSPGGAAALCRALRRLDVESRHAGVSDDLFARERRLPDGRSAWGEDGESAFGVEPVTATASVVRTFAGRPGLGETEAIERAVRYLVSEREGAGWGSPRRTAEVVRALREVPEPQSPARGERMIVRIRIDEAIAASLPGPADGGPLAATVRVPGRYLSGGRVRITFETAGPLPLDWSLRILASVPVESFVPEDRWLRLSRRTRAVRFRGETVELAPADEAVSRGERLLTTVRISSPVPRRRVLVRVPLAAGQVFLGGDPAAVDPALELPEGVRVEHSDRAVTFFVPEVGPDGFRLAFLSRAVFPGRFTVLPAEARLADAPSVRGSTAAEILYVE